MYACKNLTIKSKWRKDEEIIYIYTKCKSKCEIYTTDRRYRCKSGFTIYHSMPKIRVLVPKLAVAKLPRISV
jgi:hypothetical protein